MASEPAPPHATATTEPAPFPSNPSSSSTAFHQRFSNKLALAIGVRRFEIWFNQAVRFEYIADDCVLRVTVPNRFVAERVHRQFSEDLIRVTESLVDDSSLGRVRISVSIEPDTVTPGNATARSDPRPRDSNPIRPAPALPRPARPQDPALAGPLRHELESFVVGDCNELAYSASRSLAESEKGSSQNLLVLHGDCGLGKTHLLQGACSRYQQLHPGARVLYTTGEQFTNQYITAIRQNKLDGFRRSMRGLDLLAVDDVHFFSKKMATQQEFQHSFDHIELGGARVILASNEHPKQINAFNETLVSRLIQGLVVQIDPPDTETRRALFVQLAAKRQLQLQEAALQMLIARCDTSVREIEGALAKLHALASLHQPRAVERQVDRALVNRLHDVEQRHQPRRAVRFDEISDRVCESLQVTADQVAGSSRRQSIVLARAVIVHLTRELIGMSYPEIATAMGKRSHSTVITAAQRLGRKMQAGDLITLPGTGRQVAVMQFVEQLKTACASRA